jgi:hypothetical protein
VVLPISRPIIGATSIFAAVNVWKDFLWPLLVRSKPSAQMINIGLYHLSNGVPEDVFIAVSPSPAPASRQSSSSSSSSGTSSSSSNGTSSLASPPAE